MPNPIEEPIASAGARSMRPLGKTGLAIAPLVFGGNVFGWTVDERTSFDLLDGFVDAGFNAIDTADMYSVWVDGNQGGESETIIGRWLRVNPGRREQVLLFSKVGGDFRDGRKGLSAAWIARAVEDSLRRLHTDRIDLYQAHWPDVGTPLEETLGAFEILMKAGKVRAIGCSNVGPRGLEAALGVARAQGLPGYQTVQPEYNLCARRGFEGGLRDLAVREELGVLTYCSLARGFLTGKYRSPDDLGQSLRGKDVVRYLNGQGGRILEALDLVADLHGARPAEVALAWVMGREGVTAPIASATSREQLASLVRAGHLALSAEDVQILDFASDGWWEKAGMGPLRSTLAGAYAWLASGLH